MCLNCSKTSETDLSPCGFSSPVYEMAIHSCTLAKKKHVISLLEMWNVSQIIHEDIVLKVKNTKVYKTVIFLINLSFQWLIDKLHLIEQEKVSMWM